MPLTIASIWLCVCPATMRSGFTRSRRATSTMSPAQPLPGSSRSQKAPLCAVDHHEVGTSAHAAAAPSARSPRLVAEAERARRWTAGWCVGVSCVAMPMMPTRTESHAGAPRAQPGSVTSVAGRTQLGSVSLPFT